MGLSSKAQPPINQWYDFNSEQTVLGSVSATDSCYYVSGLAINENNSGLWDALFAKVNFDGSIENQMTISNDSVSVRTFGYTNLLPTYDTNFVTLAEFGNYFMFIKYSPEVDTVFTKTYREFYDDQDKKSIQPSKIIQLEEDSSFMVLAQLQDINDYEAYMLLMNISRNGELLSYNMYPMDESGFYAMWPGDLIRETDGYMILTFINKSSGNFEDYREHIRLIKTDLLGNELWRWTDWINLHDAWPLKLIRTGDGGYIYGGTRGYYDFESNGTHYLPRITKLNNDLSRAWDFVQPDSLYSPLDYVGANQIVETYDGNYAYSGFVHHDSMIVGVLVKINPNGDQIWNSYFSYVPYEEGVLLPHHYIHDMQITSDNGFVLVGKAFDRHEVFNGSGIGNNSWILKVDSAGCVIPGCQDFFTVEEIDNPVQLKLYPNPTSQWLNIYYYDHNYAGNAFAEVYDLNGKMVKSWKLHSNNTTYIYDVSDLTEGTYVIQVKRDGEMLNSIKFVKV